MTDIRDFNLDEWGDKMVAAMVEFGIANPAISITVNDLDTGKVAGTSNMNEESELSLLLFTVQARMAGEVSYGQSKKETLN